MFPAKEAQTTRVDVTELSGHMTIIKRDMGDMWSVHSGPSLKGHVLSPKAASEIALAF